MGAIDLLFKAKLASERLHQLALIALVKQSQILRHLLGNDFPTDTQGRECQWEPEGGLYDLAVPIGEGRRLFIELKVDSSLSEGQIRRQIQPLLRPDHANDLVLYLLLGHTAITVPASKVSWVAQQEKVSAGRYLVKTVKDLIDALEPQRLFPTGEPMDPEVGELAAAHLQHLRRLKDRTGKFFGKPIADWRSADYLGFLAHCREHKIGRMETAGIGYVSNPEGGFIGCWWAWQDAGPGMKIYLQFEGKQPHLHLCVKLKVTDRKQQSALRNRAASVLLSRSTSGCLNIKRPDRLGAGEHMTIGRLEGLPAPERGRMDEFAQRIEAAEQLVKDLAARLIVSAPPTVQ